MYEPHLETFQPLMFPSPLAGLTWCCLYELTNPTNTSSLEEGRYGYHLQLSGMTG